MFPTHYSRYTVIRLLDIVEKDSRFWYIKSIFIVVFTSLIHYLFFPVFMLYQIVIERFVIKKLDNQKKELKAENPKICIYTPWFDRYGGGAEAVAAYMAQYFEIHHPNCSVTILCDDFLGKMVNSLATLEEINSKYGTSLQTTKLELKRHGFFGFFMYDYYLQFLKTSMKYDVFINCFINVTPSNAHRNIHYLHFPWTKNEAISSFMFDLYTSNNDIFIANSNYTYGWAQKYLNPKKIITIEPPVNLIKKVKIRAKKNVIISAGRISTEKNLGVLIDAFIAFSKNNKDWEYIIVGSKNPNNENYFNQLTKQAIGYPITFHTNQSKDEYNELLRQSTIFWHAMGFGTISIEKPENAEHFGITTIEAMSHGCIPIVFDVGGPADVVRKHSCGYVWSNINELLACTKMVTAQPQLLSSLSDKAIESAQEYDQKYFYKKMSNMMRELMHDVSKKK